MAPWHLQRARDSSVHVEQEDRRGQEQAVEPELSSSACFLHSSDGSRPMAQLAVMQTCRRLELALEGCSHSSRRMQRSSQSQPSPC